MAVEPDLPGGAGERYRLVLAHSASAPKLARDFVGSLLYERGHASLADDARLCVTELVTNAYRHTDTSAIGVDVVVEPYATTVYVADDRPWSLPVPLGRDGGGEGCGQGVDEGGLGENGRGMRLVDALACAWGMTVYGASGAGRKHVWCVLAGEDRQVTPTA